jgi:L-asparagine transporter-like permease
VSAEHVELKRVLGLWDATCVVIGAIIGVGIFFNPRDVANVTGSASGALLAWTLGGVVALLGAFTFAELGRLRPRRSRATSARCLQARAVPVRGYCNLGRGPVAWRSSSCAQHWVWRCSAWSPRAAGC